MTKNPALQQHRINEVGRNAEVTLSTGYRARINPVGASLIDEVVARVKDPVVPMFYNEDKGREEENPLDPNYVEALQTAQHKRAMAAMDTLILFGLDLIDGLPDERDWLQKLKYLERRGHFDLSEYDLDDEFDLEFVFKKYIACGTQDLIMLGEHAGLNRKDVEEASKSFKS